MKVLRSFLRLATSMAHAAFRIVLLLLLALQGHFLISLWIGQPVNAPDWLIVRLERHLSDDDFELRISTISLNQGTRWKARDVSLRFHEDVEPFLTLAVAEVHFSWRSLLPWHTFTLPRSVELRNLRFLTPGRPMGIDVPVAEVIAARLGAVDGRLQPEGALVRIGTADLIVACEPDWSPSPAIAPVGALPEVSELSLRDRLQALAQLLQTVGSYIDLAEDPVASLWLSGDGENMRAEITLSADLIPHPIGGLLEGVRIRIVVPPGLETLEIKAAGSRVQLPESIEIGRWTAHSTLRWRDLLEAPSAPHHLTVVADRLSSPALETRFPVLGVSEARTESLRFEASADWLGERISGAGHVDFVNREASFSLSGRVDTARLAEEVWLPGNIPVAFIRSGTPPYLNLQIEVGPGWNPERLGFQGWIEDADLHGLPAVHGYARGQLTPTHFEADFFEVDNHAYRLSGSYSQNRDNGDFRFLLDGGFLPGDISPWMTDWWDRTWHDFEFRGDPPQINFDIQGNWNQGWNRRIFGAVSFTDLVLRDLEIDRGRTRVRFRPGLFFLEDLLIERPEGKAQGSLRWIRDPQTNQDRTLHLEVISGMDPSAYGDLVGENLAELVQRFEFSSPPTINVKGMLALQSGEPWSDREDLRVRVRAEDFFTFYGITFERMELEARYRQEKIMIDPVQVGFAGGFGYGTIAYLPDSERSVEADLSIVRADPSKAVAALPFLTAETKQRLTRPDAPGDSEKSLFSLRLDGAIDFPHLQTLDGEGEITLHTPRLADVHLLGLVSRVIEALPLPFRIGSISFDQLNAGFEATDGILFTDNLRLTSPTTRVEAIGTIDLSEMEMDLQATLFPLQEITVPLLGQLTQLLQPFGRVLDFRLHGPVDDPAIRFRLDPRNLFEEIETDASTSSGDPVFQQGPRR